MEYALYLESGPRRRKTMVHALDLVGCIAQGPTTEAALEATPDAIRAYLRFLARHGEAVEPDGDFTTAVAEHVTEGVWLGNGDPTPGFGPDFLPLSAADLTVYLRRLAWLRADLLALLRDLPKEQLLAEPETGGRSIYQILEHVAESQSVYLRYLVGKVEGLSEALRAVQTGSEDLSAALARLWQISGARLEALTEAERTQEVPHGQVTWTARRALRRMLEHDWEHFGELTRRLERIVG
jgi:uncharacterized damage-inducible protein DinB/predicted RNase H-like HicB family nuclease